MLKKSLATEGNILFKYRGQIPLILFAMAMPFIYFGSYVNIGKVAIHPLALVWVAISVIGFLVRFIAIGTTPAGTSGRNTQEQVADFLNTKGIYSTVRHPLYLGNYFIWLGIVLYTEQYLFALVFSLLYWIYYERIMYAEEDFLHTQYGASYEAWAAKTPAFIPSLKEYIPSPIAFSFKAVLRREYSGVLATLVSYAFVDICIYHFHDHVQNTPRIHFYTIGLGLLWVILGKFFRKYTSLLNEDGRS